MGVSDYRHVQGVPQGQGLKCKKKIYIYICQKIGYITNLYFCKMSRIVIKLTFI